MALDPRISLGYQPPQFQQRDVAQEQGQLMQLQNAMLQGQQLRREAAQEEGITNYLAQNNLSTPEGRAGLRQFGKTGLAYEKLLSEQEANALKRQEVEGKVREQRMKALGTGLMMVKDNPTDENLTVAFNGLDATGVDTKSFRQQFANITDINQRKQLINSYVLSDPDARASLQFVQPKPTLVDQHGKKVFVDHNPASPTYMQVTGTYEDVPLPAPVEEQKRRIAAAGKPVTNVNVSTEKRYGEEFGKRIAEADVGKMAAAEAAPKLAASADRILELVSSGKVITGAGADARLQLAKALKVAGVSDDERIANTEVLVSTLAGQTMGAIKSSGLGAGQGFTDADRDFLQSMVGKPNYDSKSLARLADLSRRTAEASAQEWNTRVKQIPSSSLQGTGISTEPIVVPKRAGSQKAGAAPAGVDPALWNAMTPQERALWK